MPKDVNLSEYELVVLFRPELEAKLDAPLKNVAKIVTDAEGKITAEEDWGRKELAYKIAGETHAIYRIYTLDLPPTAPSKISSTLNITSDVIRYLLTKVDPKVKAVLAEEKSLGSESDETETTENNEE
ncbi:30S ribosomal protein S6 [Candidatus Saccharibacteria bacterium]|nr:30S ribosomal protein S6 [Candidatus Saccharibacteria bacterium]